MTLSNRNIYGFFSLICLGGFAWLTYTYWQTGFTSSNNSTVCLFKKITDYPCPACGTTRSVIHLFHGEWKQAIMLNPLGLLAFCGLMLFPIWMLADFLLGKRTLANVYVRLHEMKLPRYAVVLASILLLANWIWNIIKGF